MTALLDGLRGVVVRRSSQTRRMSPVPPAEPAAPAEPVEPVEPVEPARTAARGPGAPTPTPQPDSVETLAARVRGPVLRPGDAGYEAEITGYNRTRPLRPALAVGATGAADVVAAVAFAAATGRAVGVLATGHGPPPDADDAVLITTSRMRGVHVDPVARTARIEAGTRWEQVVHEAAAVGLAPLSGSSPHVGAVGYTLGGGLGLLGRAFGYAADHVRGIDVVTAPGTLRHVTPHQYPDLFWGLRGGGGMFGVVTSMDIDLFPVPHLTGGGLFFRGSDAPAVLRTYRRWTSTVSGRTSSSLGLVRVPHDVPAPPALRGHFVAHLRVAHLGGPDETRELLAPLRSAAPALLDTVDSMSYRDAGTIHADPVDSFPVHEDSVLLRRLDEDAADALLDVAGPDATCPLRLVELRHLGGALSSPPAQPNAVVHRDAEFLLYIAGVAAPGEDRTSPTAGVLADHARRVRSALEPWSDGHTVRTFLGTDAAERGDPSPAYTADDLRRLTALKRTYDPDNVFRIGPRVAPTTPARPA